MTVRLPTAPTVSLNQTEHRLDEYLSTRIGQAFTITGPYGSGKTHLIACLMRRVERLSGESSPGSHRPVQLYINCKNPAFLSIYRAVAGQLSPELLRILSASMLLKIATERAGEQRRWAVSNLAQDKSLTTQKSVPPAGEKAQEQEKVDPGALSKLRLEPSVVEEYIRRALVLPERVLGSRSSEITEITAEARDDFRKVVFYLGDANLASDARDWLTGRQELSSAAKERLGVKHLIDGPVDALAAFRLIVRMFQDAEIPFLLYMDQIDQLMVGIDEVHARENAERLKSLVEYFLGSNAFLVLCGPETVWRYFGPDFFTRVGPAIRVGDIPRGKCNSLVKVYLQEGEAFEEYREPSEILPFSPDAADEIWNLRGGNARRFIQTCHQAFALHLNSNAAPIDRQLVRNVVTDHQALLSRDTLGIEIRKILKDRNLRVSTDGSADGFTKDFVVGEPGRPLVIIKILGAAFYRDEAANALKLVKELDTLRRKLPQVRTAVVAVGYASAEVQEQLQRVFDLTLVYEGEGFAEEFGVELSRLLTEQQPIPLPADSGSKDEIAERVAESLEGLLGARDDQLRKLNARLDAFLVSGSEQQRNRDPGRQQQWRAWLRQDQERWDQRLVDLRRQAEDQRRRLQDDGERLRIRQSLFRFVLVAVLGFAAGFGGILAFDAIYSATMLRLFAALSLVAVGFPLGVYWYQRSLKWRIPTGFFPSIHLVRILIPLVVALYAAFMLYFFLPKLGVLFEVLLVSTGLGLSTGLPVALYLLLVHNLLFPLGLATNRIAKFSGDLAQLALRARTVRVPTHCAYRSLQNPNPIIRYFAVQALVAGAQEVKFDWLSAAAGETWYPLYQAYLRMAISQLEQSEVLTHLSVMLETNAEDPRLILAISTLAESQFRPIDPSDLTKVVLHGQLLAHGIFEKVIQPTVPMDQDMHPLAGFAATYVGPASQNRWAPLAARFREGGQLWKDGLEGPVRMELSSPELELIFTALSPYRDLGLASFYELRVHRFYVRLYRFFAEIRWLAELGDVRLSDSSEP